MSGILCLNLFKILTEVDFSIEPSILTQERNCKKKKEREFRLQQFLFVCLFIIRGQMVNY